MSSLPRLLLQAETGPAVGAGHLARCLALAQAWVDTGGAAVLAATELPSHWAERYAIEGVELADSTDAPYDCVDWTVLDGYGFTAADHEAVKAAGSRLLSIDDHAIVRSNAADLVLDQNLGATRAAYGDRTDMLLGPRYALLRREFWRLAPRVTAPQGRRLLVAMGGSPAPGTLDGFNRILADPAVEGVEVVELRGLATVVEAMTSSDLALSASGSTCWELCCSGLPPVLLPVADNQVPLAAALASHGAAEDCGPIGTVDPAWVAERVAALANDPERRARMSRRGQTLVDGRGAKRVVARLRSDLLKLRPATAGDAGMLWDWANDPFVRAAAFQSDPIPWEHHVEWLTRKLADATTWIYVAHDPDRRPVGVVRFQGNGSCAEISVAVAADRRGQGWGPAVIDAGVRRLFAETSISRVTARIKPENAASISSFEHAGFRPCDRTAPWLDYARQTTEMEDGPDA